MTILKRALIVLMLCCACAMGVIAQSKAEGAGWVNGNLYAYEAADQSPINYGCSFNRIPISDFLEDDQGNTYATTSHTIGCSKEGGQGYSFIKGWISDPDGSNGRQSVYAMDDPNDDNYLPLRIQYPNTDKLWQAEKTNILVQETPAEQSSHIAIYSNAPENLNPKYGENHTPVVYEIDNTKARYQLDIPNELSSVVASENGGYIVLKYGYDPTSHTSGFIRIDMQSGDMTKYEITNVNYAFSSINTISTDGRYVIANNIIYDLNSCKYTNNVYIDCHVRDLNEYFSDYYGVIAYVLAASVEFSSNNTKITAVISHQEEGSDGMDTETRFEIYLHPPIKYIALGDSFSSGEGDLTPKDQYSYRWGTDVKGDKNHPTEKCHVSEKSYPYLLAGRMNYGDPNVGADMTWASVACSGALINDVNGQNSSQYMGQEQDDASRLYGFNAEALKQEALDNMIPGRQKQIEFIKKYQPKAITITIGGNDANFSLIINTCVSPDILHGGELATVCSYAKDPSKRSFIGDNIKDLQDKLIATYREILVAGPTDMRLYVVGYPQFVDSDAPDKQCGSWVGLTQPERQMITESVNYLNQVIRYATDTSGAIYISNSTSLGNHTLCGTAGNKAVNGIVLNDQQASFHPNSLGHKLMADRIEIALEGKNLTSYVCHDGEYVTCPGGNISPVIIPPYFKKAMETNPKAINSPELTKKETVTAGSPTAINIVKGLLGRFTIFKTLGLSDRYDLGTYATNSDGTFTGEVTLPKEMPTGYHTLVIEGTDPNGEQIRIWKIVYVENSYDEKSTPKTTSRMPSESSKPKDASLETALSKEAVTVAIAQKSPQKIKGTQQESPLNVTATKTAQHSHSNEYRSPLLYIAGFTVLFAILTLWLLKRHQKT